MNRDALSALEKLTASREGLLPRRAQDQNKAEHARESVLFLKQPALPVEDFWTGSDPKAVVELSSGNWNAASIVSRSL